jgi:hypothetical protein
MRNKIIRRCVLLQCRNSWSLFAVVNFISTCLKHFRAWFSSRHPRTEANSVWISHHDDIPVGGFILPEEDLFEKPYFKIHLEFLDTINPLLKIALVGRVIPTEKEAQAEMIKLNQMNDEAKRLDTVRAEAEASLMVIRSVKFAEENHLEVTTFKKPEWYFLLTVGLAFMVFLGISDISGIEVQNIEPEQYFLALLCLAAAMCITVGIKEAMVWFGRHSRRYDPRRSFADDTTHLDQVAWWIRFARGEGALWMGLAFVSLEVCMAYPGLLNLMQSQNLFSMVAAFGGAALAATTNVAFAFILGVEEAHHLRCQELDKRSFQERLDQLHHLQEEQGVEEHNMAQHRVMNAAKTQLEHLQQQISEQKALVKDLQTRSRIEYTRWECAVRKELATFRGQSQGNDDQSTENLSNGKRLPPPSNQYNDLKFK